MHYMFARTIKQVQCLNLKTGSLLQVQEDQITFNIKEMTNTRLKLNLCRFMQLCLHYIHDFCDAFFLKHCNTFCYLYLCYKGRRTEDTNEILFILKGTPYEVIPLYQEKEKILVVPCSNTIHYPNAVMVHFKHTSVTCIVKRKG